MNIEEVYEKAWNQQTFTETRLIRYPDRPHPDAEYILGVRYVRDPIEVSLRSHQYVVSRIVIRGAKGYVYGRQRRGSKYRNSERCIAEGPLPSWFVHPRPSLAPIWPARFVEVVNENGHVGLLTPREEKKTVDVESSYLGDATSSAIWSFPGKG